MDNARVFIAPDGFLRLIPPPAHDLQEVKEDMGATWDEAAGAWRLPALRMNVLQVIEALGRDRVDMTEDVLALGDGHGFPLRHAKHPMMQTLFPYQREAVQYLISNPHGVLANISPGLGKTAISVVAAQALSISRALIVAPASLMHTWWREIEKWAVDPSIEIAHGNEPVFGQQFTITTYDTVARHPVWFEKHKWDLLILDETVLIKNKTTKRFKAIESLCKACGRVWLLSGSPITRDASDLWTQIHLTYPVAFRSFWRFANRFCVFENNVWAKTGRSIVGTRAARDIAWELGDLMLTINQEDVLDLPEFLPETVGVQLTPAQQRAYASMLHEFTIVLAGKELKAQNKLSQLIRLQQVTSGLANFDMGADDSAKADALIDLLAAQAYETPMVVWTHWRGSAARLTRRLQGAHVNAEWVSGEDSTKVRDRKLEAYKAGKTDVLVLSLGVGKYGHTLTNTRTHVFLDKTWSADDYVQSLRRTRRIGLMHRPVLLTLRAPGTVDDLVEMNLEGKMPSIAKVTNSQLRELLEGLGR